MYISSEYLATSHPASEDHSRSILSRHTFKMKIYAVAILVLTGGLCVDALLSSGGLLGGLLGGSSSGSSVGGTGGLLGGLLGGGNGGLLGGILGGGAGGGLLDLSGLINGLTQGGGVLGLDLTALLKGLDLQGLTAGDLGGLLSSLTNNTGLNLSSLLQGLTGKDGPLSIVTKLLQQILCLLKSLNLPLVKDILKTVSQTALLGLEQVCNAPGGADLLSGLLPGLLSKNGTLLAGLGGLFNTLSCLLKDVVPANIDLPIFSGLLKSGAESLDCKNGSLLGKLPLDFVLNTVNSLLGSLLPPHLIGSLLGELLKNLGLKADILNNIIDLKGLVQSVVCLVKSLKLENVVELVKKVANSIQLEILDNLCQTDQGLLNSILQDINNISQPLLGKILCLFNSGIGPVLQVVGAKDVEKFVGGLCANGTLVGVLQNFGFLVAPVTQLLKDAIGLTGIKLDDIIKLLASLGITDIDQIRLFLVQINCLLKSISLNLISTLIESLTDDVLIKMTPALCSLGKLDEIIVGLLTGNNWEKIKSFVYVGGVFDLALFQKLVCLAKKFGIIDAISLIKTSADITAYSNLFCKNGAPTYSLFDDVKRKCITGLNANCQAALNTAVSSNNCAACTTAAGTGCDELTGLLPADVVTECNAKCVACKTG